MWDIPDKVANEGVSNAGKHLHSEYNNRSDELEKYITATGIVLTSYPADPNGTPDPDKTMTAQAGARYGSMGTAATDSGVANAYVLSAVGDIVAPKALFTRMRARWIVSATNTGASTINAFGLGVKKLLDKSDQPLTANRIKAGSLIEVEYDATLDSANGAFFIVPWADPTAIEGHRSLLDADQTIPSATHTTIDFEAATAPSFATISNGVVTFTRTGSYLINCVLVHNCPGSTSLSIYHNNAEIYGASNHNTGGTNNTLQTIAVLPSGIIAVGDTAEAKTWMGSSNQALVIDPGNLVKSQMSIVRLGD